jgi:hypothetical protein
MFSGEGYKTDTGVSSPQTSCAAGLLLINLEYHLNIGLYITFLSQSMLHHIWNWNTIASETNYQELVQVANCHNSYLCDFLQYLKASFMIVIHNHIFPFLYFLSHMNRSCIIQWQTLCSKHLAHECIHMRVRTHTHTHTHTQQSVC